MQISLSTGTFYHRSLGYSLGLARDAGFDGVELVLGERYILSGTPAYARAQRAYGLPILSVHPPFYPIPGWPLNPVARLRHVTGAAAQLGAGVAVSHVPLLTSADSRHGQRFSEAIRQGQRVGGDAVELTLESTEYIRRQQRYLLDDLATLVRFAQERGCGITLDTCHAGANGEDLLECYQIVRPALRNVHLSDVYWKDGEPQTHVLPGRGVLHLERLLAVLARDGYNGLITFEIHPNQVGLFGRQRHLERLREAVDFVRAAIAIPDAPNVSSADIPSTSAQTPSA